LLAHSLAHSLAATPVAVAAVSLRSLSSCPAFTPGNARCISTRSSWLLSISYGRSVGRSRHGMAYLVAVSYIVSEGADRQSTPPRRYSSRLPATLRSWVQGRESCAMSGFRWASRLDREFPSRPRADVCPWSGEAELGRAKRGRGPPFLGRARRSLVGRSGARSSSVGRGVARPSSVGRGVARSVEA
jgi:hypothetical protein